MSSSSSYTRPEATRRRFLMMASLLVSLLSLWCVTPSCLAEGWRDDLPQAQLNGNGELRWFGFRIYSASLWSESVPFDPHHAFALELTYARAISRERLVKASIEEIRRLSGSRYTEAQYSQWQTLLENTFRDVVEGDQLAGVYLPGVGVRFYNRTQLLAQISDPEFAQAFFNIWLDPQSRDAQLRKHLLGEK